ncbi:MAG TPA: hypothetical protein VF980_08470 [Thermoanaerobaculia bacterium]
MTSRALALAAVLVIVSAAADAQTFDLQGFATGRAMSVTGPTAWTRGGLGRFDAGGSPSEKSNSDALADLNVGFDWQPVQHILVHAQGVARAEPSGTRGRGIGLATAFVEANIDKGQNTFIFRGGQFFLGTSRENVQDLWTSPYLITYSALNSWIANEVRPIGLHGEWQLLTRNAVITTGLTAFEGNDTMGALLVWRGWTVGNRLSLLNESVALPPLEAFKTDFPLQHQRTTPFQRDLDGRPGFAARLRYSVPERFNVQFTRVDNRGDRKLHGTEYAWDTTFDHIGAEGHLRNTTALAEWMSGHTQMGPAATAIDVDFYAAYLLLSQKVGRHRFSARYDSFNTKDRKQSLTDRYDETGHGVTVGWLVALTPHVRAGAEVSRVVGEHLDAEESGLEPRFNGRSVILEVRYSIK